MSAPTHRSKPHRALFAALASALLTWGIISYPPFFKILKPPPGDPSAAKPPEPPPEELNHTPPPESETDSGHAPLALLEILRRDPRGSTPEDRAALWAFLKGPVEDKPALFSEWLLGADQVLAWLRGTEGAEAEVAEGLLQLVSDGRRPGELRECALEHMGLWTESHGADASTLKALKQTALAHPHSRVSSLALIALFKSRPSKEDVEWITATAAEIVCASGDVSARTLALELLESARHPGTLGLAMTLLQGTPAASERICALQILGRQGTQATLDWLKTRPEETDPIAADARKKAAERLVRRLSGVP